MSDSHQATWNWSAAAGAENIKVPERHARSLIKLEQRKSEAGKFVCSTNQPIMVAHNDRFSLGGDDTVIVRWRNEMRDFAPSCCPKFSFVWNPINARSFSYSGVPKWPIWDVSFSSLQWLSEFMNVHVVEWGASGRTGTRPGESSFAWWSMLREWSRAWRRRSRKRVALGALAWSDAPCRGEV